MRNSPGVFLGIRPNGDTLNVLNGGESNGPANRLALKQFVDAHKRMLNFLHKGKHVVLENEWENQI